jgi:hypothetical protein
MTEILEGELVGSLFCLSFPAFMQSLWQSFVDGAHLVEKFAKDNGARWVALGK